MARTKRVAKILTPDGAPMDYKVQKLKVKKPEDKVKEQLKAKAAKGPRIKKAK